jgi:tetratricopeptide (TPR) repeat protein
VRGWARAALALFLLACPGAAWAGGQSAPATSTAPVSLEALITALLQQERFDEARRIVEPLLKSDPKNTQLLFLTGLIAFGRGDTQRAIAIFREILIDHPDAERVRLELARAFFVAKDYGNAARQFNFARAGHPPAPVLANIDRYLFAIRQAKALSYSLEISVAPDTNLNGGSASQEVTLYGLPFDLSDDARRRSGVGLEVDASGEWAPRLSPATRLRLGASAQRREYSGGRFDDLTAAAYAGPRFVTPRWDLSLLATANRRWYGGVLYSTGRGARITATYYPSPQIALTTDLGSQQIDFDSATYMNGRLTSLGETAMFALTPSSGVIVKAGGARHNAGVEAYSNRNGYLSAGYFRDFPHGFSAYVETAASLTRYDAAVAAFGRRRVDVSSSTTVNVLNRHIVFSRFTPRLSYTYTSQHSTIPLYRFDRSRLEMGLTTQF